MMVIDDSLCDGPDRGRAVGSIGPIDQVEPLQGPMILGALPSHGRVLTERWIEDDRVRGLELDGGYLAPPLTWERIRDFVPCNHALRSGYRGSVVRWWDFYTPTELHNTAALTEYLRLHRPGRPHRRSHSRDDHCSHAEGH
jgi:hypothetical protein